MNGETTMDHRFSTRQGLTGGGPVNIPNIGLDDPFPSSFIEYLKSLPSTEIENDFDRPAKRHKPDNEQAESVTVGRGVLAISRKEVPPACHDLPFTRRDVGKYLAFEVSPASSDECTKLWITSVGLRTKQTKQTKQAKQTNEQRLISGCIELAPGSFGKEIVALCIRPGRKDQDGFAGTVDMEVYETHDDIVVKLSFELRWNCRLFFGKTLTARATSSLVQKVVDVFIPSKDQPQEIADWSPRDFYKAAFVPDKDDRDAHAIEILGLNAHLYPFQKRALKWLLAREGVRWSKPQGSSTGMIRSCDNLSNIELPLSFREIKDADGKVAYTSDLFNLVTTDLTEFRKAESIRGGILAEEMGLGKTLEIISLVLLHRRLDMQDGSLLDPGPEKPGKTGATLIVTPVPLCEQWRTEVASHAPHLRVTFYDGCHVEDRDEEVKLIQHLAAHDIVITTYPVLTNEVWLARELPNRPRRFERAYHRPRSPLIQLEWWRICLDEAQMIDSGVSKAAEVAKILPRVNSWAISGTPVKKDVQDLRGLLIFLHYAPYNSSPNIWQALTTRHKHVFQQVFNRLALRHTKPMVRHEIKLPHQDRFVITVPFSAVEEHQYQSLVKEMAQDCGLDVEGNPVSDNWDPDEYREKMMGWLRKLRISAVYPMSDLKYHRRKKPPQTEAEALDMLIELSEADIHSKLGAYLDFKLRRGMMLENGPRVKEALAIWQEVCNEVSTVVAETETKIQVAIGEKPEEEADGPSGDEDEPSNRAVVAEYRRKQRLALEIQHKAVFCCGNAYFQIRTNPELTDPDSDEFKRLQALEDQSYQEAQAIRMKVFHPALNKASRMMEKIGQKATDQSFVTISEATIRPEKGLESRTVLDSLEGLCDALNAHAGELDDWREEIVKLLLQPLVQENSQDEDEMANEWADSITIQGKLEAYVKVLDAAIADREDAINGGVNFRVKHEMAMARVDALKEDPQTAESEMLIALSDVREKIKPPELLGSVRGAISRLRQLQHMFAGSTKERDQLEAEIATLQLQHAAKLADEQSEVAKALHQELRMFSAVMKARMDFYNQLQQISDELDPYDGPRDEGTLARRLGEEQRLKNELRNAEMKRKYLLHMKESGGKKEDAPCIICQSPFVEGTLTACGHLFCRECMRLWWRAKRNCPLCKAHLHIYDLLDVVIRRQEMQVRSDVLGSADPDRHPRKKRDESRKSTIYAEFSVDKLAAIKSIDLAGDSATSTKINMLVRHIGWLRRADPGAKSIVFTSFPFFLRALKQAFREHGITYTSMGSAEGISQFKSDPSIEVFLLHAQAHASGLNLVEANHVFLCEPLLNTALELQAIARVDRIGQAHETTVWLYLMKGTVEESIYNLSVSRRMHHIGTMTKGKGKEPEREADETLEEANRVEMESSQLSRLLTADGEVVDPNDLSECLFGLGAARSDQDATTNTGSEEAGVEMLEVP